MLHPLDRYLYLSGTSVDRFAKMVGVSRPTVDKWRFGKASWNGKEEDVLAAIERRNTELQMALDISEKILHAQSLSY